MTLITVQDSKVLKTLLDNKTHIADFLYIVDIDDDSPSVVTSYQLLMNHYDYKNAPVFCCALNRIADFSAVTIKPSSVLLELDVPDEFIKLQVAGDWCNIMTYVHYKCPFGVLGWTLGALMDILDGKNTDCEDLAIQATIPYIKPEWLNCAYEIPKHFIKFFNNERITENTLLNRFTSLIENKRYVF